MQLDIIMFGLKGLWLIFGASTAWIIDLISFAMLNEHLLTKAWQLSYSWGFLGLLFVPFKLVFPIVAKIFLNSLLAVYLSQVCSNALSDYTLVQEYKGTIDTALNISNEEPAEKNTIQKIDKEEVLNPSKKLKLELRKQSIDRAFRCTLNLITTCVSIGTVPGLLKQLSSEWIIAFPHRVSSTYVHLNVLFELVHHKYGQNVNPRQTQNIESMTIVSGVSLNLIAIPTFEYLLNLNNFSVFL